MTTKPITEFYNLYDLSGYDADARAQEYLDSVTDSKTGEITADPEALFAAMAEGGEVEDQISKVLEYNCKYIRNQEVRLRGINVALEEISARIAEITQPLIEEADRLNAGVKRIQKDIDYRKGAIHSHILSKGKAEEGRNAGKYPPIDLGTFKLRATISKSVHIDEALTADRLPNKWRDVKYVADKKAIKAGLENGEMFKGVGFKESTSLTIT